MMQLKKNVKYKFSQDRKKLYICNKDLFNH